jgi:hypothetical protein
MELLLIATYSAICVAVFKIFRIPVNKWTVPTAVPGGRAVALIDIDEDTSGYNIPGGAEAQVAVYTPYAHHFAIIRRILLRMRSWQNFVFLEGHGGGGGAGGH